MGVNCFSHPVFYGVNCSSHHVIRSWVLTVLATLFCVVLTVQVTMSFVHASHHVLIAFSRVLTVLATLFRTVLTVQATRLLLVM